MNLTLFLAGIVLALLLSAVLWTLAITDRRRRHRTGTLAANIAEGSREFDSLVPDVTIPSRFLLAVRGSDTLHFTLAGALARAFGVCEDQSSVEAIGTTPGLPFRIRLLGVSNRTMKVAINSTVAQDDLLVCDATGYAKTIPAPVNGTPATFWVIGSAQQAGAASGVAATPTVIEFIGCLPYPLTH